MAQILPHGVKGIVAWRPTWSCAIKYTWYGASPEEKQATRDSWNALDVVLTAIVVACVVWFYISFW